MTKIILTFVLYLVSIVGFAQQEKNDNQIVEYYNIIVSVKNISNNKGNVFFWST